MVRACCLSTIMLLFLLLQTQTADARPMCSGIDDNWGCGVGGWCECPPDYPKCAFYTSLESFIPYDEFVTICMNADGARMIFAATTTTATTTKADSSTTSTTTMSQPASTTAPFTTRKLTRKRTTKATTRRRRTLKQSARFTTTKATTRHKTTKRKTTRKAKTTRKITARTLAKRTTLALKQPTTTLPQCDPPFFRGDGYCFIKCFDPPSLCEGREVDVGGVRNCICGANSLLTFAPGITIKRPTAVVMSRSTVPTTTPKPLCDRNLFITVDCWNKCQCPSSYYCDNGATCLV